MPGGATLRYYGKEKPLETGIDFPTTVNAIGKFVLITNLHYSVKKTRRWTTHQSFSIIMKQLIHALTTITSTKFIIDTWGLALSLACSVIDWQQSYPYTLAKPISLHQIIVDIQG